MGSSSMSSTEMVSVCSPEVWSPPSVLPCTFHLSFAARAHRGDGYLDHPPVIMMTYRDAASDGFDPLSDPHEAELRAGGGVGVPPGPGFVDEQRARLGLGAFDHHGAGGSGRAVLGHVDRALL